MLKRLEIAGFKSFARKTALDFSNATTAIVGPNGSGKSNLAEAFRFALGEQSTKSMRGKKSEDLIWSGSSASPRANRAAVAVVFDNRKRIFPKIDFDEVTIERAVFRDGASEYSVNGSKVRLRDVHEFLASANIGQTGHHIISQGEADRILLAQPRERRAMLEDALGLKVFEFKKQEAERKLEKTAGNMREVEIMRRELAPHIRFLKKQVERVERAEQLAVELRESSHEYFALEESYLVVEGQRTEKEREEARVRLERAAEELRVFDERTTNDAEGAELSRRVREQEREIERLSEERAELSRKLGKNEGALEGAKQRSQKVAHEPYVKVPRDDLKQLREEARRQTELPEDAPQEQVVAALKGVASLVDAFWNRFMRSDEDLLADEEQLVNDLEEERSELSRTSSELEGRVQEARAKLSKMREASMAHDETGREERHRILGLAEGKAKEESELVRLEERLRELVLLKEEYERDRREVLALAGPEALQYEARGSLPEEPRKAQEDRKRELERTKIRLEEAGGIGTEVKEEYEETTGRDSFLEHELVDLGASAEKLRGLIDDLDDELAKTFAEGLVKVNRSFDEFFGLMFGGGSAKLTLEAPSERQEELDEEEEESVRRQKPGIEVSVHLPKKRVQSLMQLSGGERALTSIALIFAMSQVNPPPFLILDETDAALDEANSRRYGDMLENLAKKSQLIVITHNRETMSRAGILYGVTMGGDSMSKLLSVKFEEAVKVAK